MAGGFASALGEAILQGSRGYQGALGQQLQLRQQQFENNRQMQADARAAEEHAQTVQLLMDRVRELPVNHAKDDLAALQSREGINVFNMPGAVKLASDAGTPFQQIPGGGMGVTRARIGQIEGAPASANPQLVPVDSQQGMAAKMGVAPDTGVIIPKQFIAQDVAQERALQRDKALTDFMSGQMNGTPGASGTPTTGPTGAPEPARYNPDEYRKWQMEKTAGLPSVEPVESAQHKLWMEQQTLTNKAAYKPPSAATERERLSYEKALLVIPQLRAALMKQVADPSDPHGQKFGLIGSLGAKMKQEMRAAQYGAGLPTGDTDDLAQQLAGALRVIGTAPYMNGSRSSLMFNESADHVINRHFTPEAQLQRIDTLEPLFKEFEQLSGIKAPQVAGQQQQPPAPVAGAAPTAAAPQAAPQASTPMLASGMTLPYAEVTRRAQLLGQDPNTFAASLKAEGVNVVK